MTNQQRHRIERIVEEYSEAKVMRATMETERGREAAESHLESMRDLLDEVLSQVQREIEERSEFVITHA